MNKRLTHENAHCGYTDTSVFDFQIKVLVPWKEVQHLPSSGKADLSTENASKTLSKKETVFGSQGCQGHSPPWIHVQLEKS